MIEVLFGTFEGWIAVFTALLIIVQLTLAFLGLDFDADFPDIDSDFGGWDMSTLYSVKGLIQFLAGASWYLVLTELDQPLEWYNYLIAIAVGAAVDVIIVFVYFSLSRLQTQERPLDKSRYVGKDAIIYASKGDGWYEIQVSTPYGIEELTVKADSDEVYSTGRVVFIEKYENGILFIH